DGHLALSLNEADAFTVEETDLSRLDAAAAMQEAETQVRAYCAQLNPVEGEWLTRARLWRLPDGVLAAISGSHIVADAGSRNIIMDELLDALGPSAPPRRAA